MTREELEVVIWQHGNWTNLTASSKACQDVDAILTAVDAYAAEQARETVAAMVTDRNVHAIHLVDHLDARRGTACNRRYWIGTGEFVTTDPAAVTCGKCVRTDVYRAAKKATT